MPNGSVLVIGEHCEGKILNVTLELLNTGKGLADALHTKLSVVLAGFGTESMARELSHYGPDEVVCLEHPLLAHFSTEAFSIALTEHIKKENPWIVLIGSTCFGRDCAAKIAALCDSEVITDCASLEIESETGLLLATRPRFDGKSYSVLCIPNKRPQIASVRAGVLTKALRLEKGCGHVVTSKPHISLENLQTRLLVFMKNEGKGEALTDAKIVVAGGRGMRTEQGFEILRKLAEKLGAQLGCTRPCVDSGWVSASMQIGQTGVLIKPDIYLAFGISGAVQHITGIARTKCVIAINKDPNAPIFRESHYGVIGDASKVAGEMLALLD